MKKIVALLLTAVMVLGCMPGLAENTKHERVYVVATADGTIKSITDSVRLENADGLDEIMDQTILSDIQNVGGKETFTLDEKTLTWKANGKDIVYQGTSDKTPVLLPVVTLTLDGADASFADLKNKTGDAVLTVTYQQQAALPILAVTVLPLPQEGITDLKLENAAILSEMGRQALVGWAVPGADEKLNLPASFTASFHADHADLNWMMTFSSADPVDTVCRELNERIDLDIHTEMDEVKLLLKAVQNGEALPESGCQNAGRGETLPDRHPAVLSSQQPSASAVGSDSYQSLMGSPDAGNNFADLIQMAGLPTLRVIYKQTVVASAYEEAPLDNVKHTEGKLATKRGSQIVSVNAFRLWMVAIQFITS